MTIEEKEEKIAAIERRLPKGCFLQRLTSQSQGRVWAARCLFGQHPHRYTLRHGEACWDYWKTLDEALEALAP